MNKKLKELVVLVLTATSVLVILLQYALPLTQTQTQFNYILDLIIVGVLAVDFHNRARKEEKVFRSFSKISTGYLL
jgi:hypothetical protein